MASAEKLTLCRPPRLDTRSFASSDTLAEWAENSRVQESQIVAKPPAGEHVHELGEAWPVFGECEAQGREPPEGGLHLERRTGGV